MPRLPVLSRLHGRCVILLGRQTHRGRLAHSHARRPSELSVPEVTIGLVVLYSSFLIPSAWVMSHLAEYRRQ